MTAMTISGEYRRQAREMSCLAPWHIAYTSASPVVRDTYKLLYRHGRVTLRKTAKEYDMLMN